jgi:hypothetical protein
MEVMGILDSRELATDETLAAFLAIAGTRPAKNASSAGPG